MPISRIPFSSSLLRSFLHSIIRSLRGTSCHWQTRVKVQIPRSVSADTAAPGPGSISLDPPRTPGGRGAADVHTPHPHPPVSGPTPLAGEKSAFLATCHLVGVRRSPDGGLGDARPAGAESAHPGYLLLPGTGHDSVDSSAGSLWCHWWGHVAGGGGWQSVAPPGLPGAVGAPCLLWIRRQQQGRRVLPQAAWCCSRSHCLELVFSEGEESGAPSCPPCPQPPQAIGWEP